MNNWYVFYNDSDELMHYGTKGHSGVYTRTPKINSATDYTNPLSKSKVPSTKELVRKAKKMAEQQMYKRLRDMYNGSKEIPNNVKITGVQITGIDKKTGTFTYKVHFHYKTRGGKLETSSQDFIKGKAKF